MVTLRCRGDIAVQLESPVVPQIGSIMEINDLNYEVVSVSHIFTTALSRKLRLVETSLKKH